MRQENKIFQKIPRSQSSAKWILGCAQKCSNVDWKTLSKISCHYTWLLHAKNCPSRWRFFGSFLTASKPSRRSITAAKRKEKEEKERRKKKFKNFDFCARTSQNVVKRDASDKKGKLSRCKCIFDQIKANLDETQPKNHQNVQKTHFFAVPGVNVLMSWVSLSLGVSFSERGLVTGSRRMSLTA